MDDRPPPGRSGLQSAVQSLLQSGRLILANDLYGPPPHPHWMLDLGSLGNLPESVDGQPVIVVTSDQNDIAPGADRVIQNHERLRPVLNDDGPYSSLSARCYPDKSSQRLVQRPDIVKLARLVMERSGAQSGALYPWLSSVGRQTPAAGSQPLSLARTVWETATAKESRVIEVARARLPTPIGEFVAVVMKWPGESREFLGLLSGDHPPVGDLFIHHACPLGDTFIAQACDCRSRFEVNAQKVASDRALLLYFNHADSPFTADGEFRCSKSTSPELSVEAEIAALSMLAALTDGRLSVGRLDPTSGRPIVLDRLVASARSDELDKF
jgi:hypothetical protein